MVTGVQTCALPIYRGETDVAHRRGGEARNLQDGGEHADGRGLAVGAGDGDPGHLGAGRDDWRSDRRRDVGAEERRPFRGDRKPGRLTDRSGRGGPRDRKDDRRGRPPQRQRIPEPAVPDDVEPGDLEWSARAELRALGRANAENVARHLVMTQRLLDNDPHAAYEHARYAASHAGRVAVVRETAGIAAYLKIGRAHV